MSSVADLVVGAIRNIQSSRYAELASSTIVVWDHLITLNDEVELIWRSSWSMGKILFIINRYYTLCCVIINNYGLFTSTLTESFCRHFFQWQGWTGLIACMLAEAILQMRLYAMYFLNKKVLLVMVTSYIVSSAASAAVMAVVLFTEISVSSHLIPGFPFCVPLNVPHYFYTLWIPVLAFESLLCGLALFRGFQTFRTNNSLFTSGRHLVGILVRDSILYYLVMFATYLTNVLVWTAGDLSLLEIPIGFSVAMSCVMCNRLVLNVRRAKLEMELAKKRERPATPRHPDLSTGFFAASNFVPQTPSAVQDSVLSDIEMDQLRSMRAETPNDREDYGQFIAL